MARTNRTVADYKIAQEQPTAVCRRCATKYSTWVQEQKPLPIAEYHTAMCDVCLKHDTLVTHSNNVGLLVEGWTTDTLTHSSF